MKQLLATILLLAACSNSEPSSSRYTHQAPDFALTVPGGFQVEATDDGVAFHGDREIDDIKVSWRAADVTATQARDEWAGSTPGTNEKVTGTGDLPGGVAWVSFDGPLGKDFDAFLVVGGQLIECDAEGAQAALDACKSLAPK